MGRSPCCSMEGLNRGAWTAHEDKILIEHIRVHGEGRWRNLPKRAGLKRCGKSCRLRWLNYLRPDIKRGNISQDEEELIIRLHKLLGNRWSLIAGRLPGRTDNEIKNYWNTNLSKKVKDRHQTNGKNTEIPKPQLSPTVTASPSLSPNSHVVRTKATKCSKVLFINPFPHPSMQLHNKSKPEATAEAEPLLAVDTAANHSTTNQVEPSMDHNGFSSFDSFPAEEKEHSPTDFLGDFNMGEICLSDLLNSDFSDNMCDFSCANNSSYELSPYTDQPVVFSDEILNDWTQKQFC